MTWVAVGVGVAGLATSAYSAKKGAKSAKDAARATQTHPVGVNSPMGFTGMQDGQMVAHAAPNPFQNMFGNLGLSSLANAGAANGMAYNGANPELLGALQGADSASRPGSNEFMDVLNRMRAISAPEDRRNQVALDDQQFAMGTLGTTGGAERFRALKESQNDADLKRQMAAQGIATENGNARFQRALTSVNQGMSNQQQQFNIGSAANANQQNLFSQLLSQMGMGVAAGGGQAPGAAMYAAQQAGNVPLAISQGLNNPAFATALQGIFNRTPPPAHPSPEPMYIGGMREGG